MMIPRILPRLLTIAAACMLASCGDDAAGGDSGGGHAHAHKGEHGGALLDVGGGIAHLEFVHDHDAGTVTLHVTGKDAKTPMKLTFAPDLNLKTAEGPKVVRTKPVGGDSDGASKFTVTDPLLKADPLEGQIAMKIGGKPYHPEIQEVDDH